MNTKNNDVGQKLNNLHQDLQTKERRESYIIRLRAMVGEPVSRFTRKLSGRAKNKEIAAQFDLLATETYRLIPDPKAWSIFLDWVHHHKLVGALRGMDLKGEEEKSGPQGWGRPPSDWLPDHPIVNAAKKKNVRNIDGSRFFEPYPVDQAGMVAIARYDEVIKMPTASLMHYLDQLEDVRSQLALELSLTKATTIKTRAAARDYGAALPFAPEQVIKRKRPEAIEWKNTTKVVTLPADEDLSKFKVFTITICKDGSMCHHVRQPEVFLGSRRVQQERTVTCKPGLPMMERQPQRVLEWMDLFFAGLDTAEAPLFPRDYQGTYCSHVVNPLGVSTEMHLGLIEEPKVGRVVGRMISSPAVSQLMPSSLERAFANAG